MNVSYRQGLHRLEPWVVVLASFLAGAATMGAAVVVLLSLQW